MRRPGLGLGFELGVKFNNQTGADGGGSANFSTSFSDISSGLFGSSETVEGEGTEKTDVTQTESLQIDSVGIMRLIDKALQGAGGLAEIFGTEAGAGLFGSSSAKQGTEDLLAKIAGELALVTGVKTATSVGEKDTTSTTTSESDGILDSIGLGGLF